MKKKLKDMTFRNKIFIVCLLISLIPVLVLGTFCYRQIRRLLIEREETALTETLILECRSLNNKTQGYVNAMNHILWDNSILQALSKSYANNYEMYLMYRDVIDPMFTTIRSLNTDFNKITVYTDNPVNPHGSELRPLKDICEIPWYLTISERQKPFFVVQEQSKTLLLVGKLQEPSAPYTNIIVIDIDYQKAFLSMESLYEQSYGIVLMNENQEPIYAYYSFDEAEKDYVLSAKQLTGGAGSALRQAYVIKSTNELDNEWSLYLYRPTGVISAPAKDISQIIICIILLCIVCIILISSLLSRVLVSPIELLTQKYEMKALQAQINPHFLYNSLSLINSKALMAGQEDIGKMAQLLSTFYRTTLNKGKNIITVANELENIKSYINIQFIMHSDSFDVSYDLDESTYSCTMINLLLQPLVENAIIHGIDLLEAPKRGLLSISCRRAGQNIIFEISDNGPGIPPQKLDTILLSQSSGYGIQNVHHRIQLFYGAAYGLSYHSSQAGTTVTVTIPSQSP